MSKIPTSITGLDEITKGGLPTGRNRGMYIMTLQGMKHSNQVREFVITDKRLDLVEVYLGPEGVLTGSAREAQKLQEQTGEILSHFALNSKDREVNSKRKVLEAKISNLLRKIFGDLFR